MAASLRSDFRVVWTLRSRRSLADLEFWLIVIGYDSKTHSFQNKGYFVYVALFFSVWIFTVLTLIADFAGKLLSLLPVASPTIAAVWVGVITLLMFGLIELNSAAKHSPFIFSEADATLLGQTPVDRRAITLIWLLAKWVGRGLFVWAAAVILGYALLEAQSPRDLTTADLPRYILAGGRSTLVFVPLHLCLQSLTAAIGSLRLHGRRDLPWLRWLAPLLAVGFFGLLSLTRVSNPADLPAWLWPLSYPIRAAMGDVPVLSGLVLALIWAGVGVFALWRSTEMFNLSRAVEETRNLEALQAAQLMGMGDVVQEMKQRERQGAGRQSTGMTVGRGPWAILWRNAIQSWRTLGIGKIAAWIGILGLGLGFQLVPEWGPRVVTGLAWIFFFGQQAVVPLRRELRRWWLMRQLPFSTTQLVLLNLTSPALLAGVLVAGGAFTLTFLPVPGLPMAGWLAVPAAIGVALAAGVDMLVQCKTSKLMVGHVPDVSLLVVLLGALVLGSAGGSVWLAQTRWLLPAGASVVVGMVVCLALDAGLILWVQRLSRGMK